MSANNDKSETSPAQQPTLERGRFEARARALVYARLGLMAIGLVVLMVPGWHGKLDIPMPMAAYAYLGVLAYHVGSFLWLGRRHARVAIFISLCLDVLVLLYLVAASGGIKSQLMPTQLVLTVLFALLFPSPLALLPPLLTLPIVAKVDQILGIQQLPGDLLLLLWYSALNVTLVYVIVYLEGRERLAQSELMRVLGERRTSELAQQRTRIARDIHDGVGAALSGIALQAEYLAAQPIDEELSAEVADLREAAAEGMAELRRAVSMLHEEFELATAVPDYVSAYAARHHLSVSCNVNGREPPLEPAKQLALFRVLQEALSNVARHADSDEASVTLTFEGDEVRVEVRDDGVGFEPAAVEAGRYGLRNMRERAAKIGGRVEVESAPGDGTTVRLVVSGESEPT
ncbi:MAG: sensor histidine kinase [Myxococcales bacterium]|nr:sensor histidine kinase [Myxococcales bacterium]